MLSRRFPHELPAYARSPSLPEPQRRRHRAGGFSMRSDRLDGFNRLLHRIDLLQTSELEADGIASCARTLIAAKHSARFPSSICERLRAAALLDTMSRDAGWQIAEPVARTSTELIHYIRSGNAKLIFDLEPVVGLLDDAILIDLSWPMVEVELSNYTQFRRIRIIEAELHGVSAHDFVLSRSDFIEALEADRDIHQQDRLGSFLSGPGPGGDEAARG